MKYYLLQFCKDWGDEFDVVALNCFNEEEYNQWYNKKILEPREDYEKEIKAFNERLDDYNNYRNEMAERGLDKKRFNEYTDEEREWWTANNTRSYVSLYDKPKKGYSLLHAYLGNYGDGWSDDFCDYSTSGELVENKIVSVSEVPEEFYNHFHENNLHRLSMCNIFDK